nr:hypothetical protein [Flavobacterium sp.]
MKKIILPVLIVLGVFSSACSSSEEDGGSNSTITQELQPAKTFYSNNGATFKFRVYNYSPTEGDNNNNNNHTADVNKIIENNGAISVISKYTVPSIFLQGYGAVLNAQGDYVSPQSSTAVVIQNSSFNDDFEVDNNNSRLVSYNYSGGAHGSYGFIGERIYVHNPTFFSGAISASSNQGYMHTLNDSNFMLSMGFNSNYGKPMLYRYNPSNYTWIGDLV